MHLVDVHAHLDHPRFKDDLPAVLARAKAAGVVAVITQGVSHETSLRLLELAKQDKMIKIAMGIYPSYASNVAAELPPEEAAMRDRIPFDDALSAIERHKADIVAIGEVGLDFQEATDEESRRVQIENFRKIIRLAKRIKKPLIIHSRKAEEKVLDILEEEQYLRADLHCFCGSKKLIERGVRMGLYFSIPTSVVRNAQFQQLAAMVPIGQILTETDAPYQSPERETRNEPASIRPAVEKICAIKGMDATECANAIFFNYQRLFL